MVSRGCTREAGPYLPSMVQWPAPLRSLGMALLCPPCAHCRLASGLPLENGICIVCQPCISINDGPRCPRCELPGERRLCPRCRRRRPSFDALHAPLIYDAAVAALVQRAKFRNDERAAMDLADLAVRALLERNAQLQADAVVPIPLTLTRHLHRGYNQAELIARRLAKHTGLPVCASLRRKHGGKRQSDLPLNRRTANVEGVFTATGRIPERIILVDDVATSTATVQEATTVLRRAGAHTVSVFAAARCPDASDRQ